MRERSVIGWDIGGAHVKAALLREQFSASQLAAMVAGQPQVLAERLKAWPLRLMASAAPFACTMPKVALQVQPDGQVYACEPRLCPELSPYGHVDALDLAGLHASPAYRAACRELAACNRCLLPCVASSAGSLWWQAARRLPGRLRYRGVLAGRGA